MCNFKIFLKWLFIYFGCYIWRFKTPLRGTDFCLSKFFFCKNPFSPHWPPSPYPHSCFIWKYLPPSHLTTVSSFLLPWVECWFVREINDRERQHRGTFPELIGYSLLRTEGQTFSWGYSLHFHWLPRGSKIQAELDSVTLVQESTH